ncbi:MAG: DUF411 domain-containing protein [Hyphomicrobiaceae bacterium]
MKHTPKISRRAILAVLAAGALPLPLSIALAAQTSIKVWKDPSCGCCGKWVDHLSRNGFKATVIETSDMSSVKRRLGVPAHLHSCHTAEVEGFTIEGHVPAAAIRRLLSEKPHAKGLAVPGMPIGSPGMEGGRPERYDVMLFGDGRARSFGSFVGDQPA